MYDAVIIGAGVTGAAIARSLSKYQIKALVLEKSEDVCTGTSKANSAIVHAGFDAANGSLMAEYNVKGNLMMPKLCEDLDIPFDQCGSLVVCVSEEEMPKLQALYENGIKNGVQGLQIIDRERLSEMEPNISDEAVAALWAPTGGIICPFWLTIAMAENANVNGVEFKFNTEVKNIEKTENGFRLTAADLSGKNGGENGEGAPETGITGTEIVIETKTVINAAGVYADVFHNLFSEKKIHITPRKGEYLLLDHATEGYAKHTVFQLPGKFGKGILVTPTIHGNTLLGPTADDIEDPEGTNTTREGLANVIEKSAIAMKNVPVRQVITSFAGLRAHEDSHEFVLGELEEAPGFFDAAGIESPGLTSSPAIGEYIAGLVSGKLGLLEKTDFIETRKGIVKASELPIEERNELIRKNPAYGQIICRCESISEGEIIDSIKRPLGAKSLDGVKRRVRAGMGRCQAGFCSPRVIEIIARELGIDQSEVTKSGGESKIIVGTSKDAI